MIDLDEAAAVAALEEPWSKTFSRPSWPTIWPDPVALILALRQLPGVDLADVAEEVGGEFAARIVADRHLLQHHAGQFALGFRQAKGRRLVQVGRQGDSLIRPAVRGGQLSFAGRPGAGGAEAATRASSRRGFSRASGTAIRLKARRLVTRGTRCRS